MKKSILVAIIVVLTVIVIYQKSELASVSETSVNCPVIVDPIVESTTQFILTYSCSKEQVSHFYTKKQADNFQKALDDLGLTTRYYRWRSPDSPIDTNPFYGSSSTVYHLVYYKTDFEVMKAFDNLDSARLWQLQLLDIGCIADIHEE